MKKLTKFTKLSITIGVLGLSNLTAASELRESVYQKEQTCYLCETFADLNFDEKSALEASKKNGVHIMGIHIKNDSQSIVRDKQVLTALKFNVLNIGSLLLRFKEDKKEGLMVGGFVMKTYREANKERLKAEERQNELCENGLCHSVNVQMATVGGNVTTNDVVNKFKQSPVSLVPIKFRKEGTYLVDVYYKVN